MSPSCYKSYGFMIFAILHAIGLLSCSLVVWIFRINHCHKAIKILLIAEKIKSGYYRAIERLGRVAKPQYTMLNFSQISISE